MYNGRSQKYIINESDVNTHILSEPNCWKLPSKAAKC